MKKLLYCAAALATLLFAGSCQRENLEPAVEGTTVTYTVKVPEAIATKAYTGGVNKLIYEVHRVEGETSVRLYQKNTTISGGVANVDIEVVKDQNFTILFWAQKENVAFGTTDLKAVTMPTTLTANVEDYESFYGKDEFVYATDIALTNTVELKRAVSMLNIGTTAASLNVGGETGNVTLQESAVTVEGLPNTLNIMDGVATNEANAAYGYTTDDTVNVPAGTLTVGTEDYVYVAKNYVGFAAKDKSTADVTLTILTDEGTITHEIPSVPFQRNYKTNIVGDLITANAKYSVTLTDEWATPDLAPDPIYLAAAFGGEVTLTEDIVLTSPLEVKADMTINLNGKTISAATEKGNGAVVNIAEGVSATLIGGTIKNTTENGDAVINNAGNLVLSGVEIKGAPLADGGYSAYAVISSGYMVIEEGTAISADRGSLKVTGNGETIINGGTFTNNDIGSCSLTSHVVDVEDGSTNKLTINGGTFQHLHTSTSGGVVICNRTRGTVYVNGGNFSGGNYYGNNNLSDYGYGGTFSVKGGVYDANPAAKYIATGYKSVSVAGKFHVLPEVVANAAADANVTAVTESTADVATALGTDNGEATMFMWNDVAYIAKYGEVVIASSADEATTSRGVVEYATGLTSATVAEGIEVVGNRTFRQCKNLETVVLPNTLTEIGPAVFQTCSKLANVTIPATVTAIGEGAFAECTSLTSINIPNGITRLENDVLRNTGLTSIEIPASVNYIGTYAFRDCKQLTEVIINAPEFTMEDNTFGIMAAPFTPMTIHVANAEMKAYVESKLTAHAKTYITVVDPTVTDNTADLQAALAGGKNVVLANDLTITPEEMPTAPYGNKMALSHQGGVFDGNGKSISVTANGDNYVVMTNGGTIKNLNIDRGFRGIVLMYPNQDVYVENVNIGVNDEVCYTINTAEGDGTHSLKVSNSRLNGWCSIGTAVKDVTFTNCTFGLGTYYTNVYGRLVKPYVDAIFDGCEFCSQCYLDLSAFVGTKVTVKNCTVNGVKITAENWTSHVAPEDTCAEGQISVELKNGSYLTAENIADYIVFE